MPTYDYVCKECGHAFEEYQLMNAERLMVCPNCGKPALKRLMGSGAGMLFKGSGYYQTDYKKSNGSGSPAKDSTKPEKKTEAKPESKPESKSDSKPTSKSGKKSE
ncbi:MAG: FmdB family zinc ribbon protein [Bacteroidota bacterium]